MILSRNQSVAELPAGWCMGKIQIKILPDCLALLASRGTPRYHQKASLRRLHFKMWMKVLDSWIPFHPHLASLNVCNYMWPRNGQILQLLNGKSVLFNFGLGKILIWIVSNSGSNNQVCSTRNTKTEWGIEGLISLLFRMSMASKPRERIQFRYPGQVGASTRVIFAMTFFANLF